MQRSDRLQRAVQLASVLLAAAVVLIFLFAQNPNRGGYLPKEHFSSQLKSEAPSSTLPPAAEVVALARKELVIRTPGAIANVQPEVLHKLLAELRSAAAADKPVPEVRVLITPAGADREQRETVERELTAALGKHSVIITVSGLNASSGIATVSPTDFAGMRNVLAAGEMTDQVATLIRHAITRQTLDEPTPDRIVTRAPTSAELQAALADLNGDNLFAAPGATIDTVPQAPAFSAPPVLVALPMPAAGQPVVDYATALVAHFPGRPVLQITGNWITHVGADTELGEVTTASFYGARWRVLTTRTFSQAGIASSYFNQSATVRVSGIFDRPIPLRPNDDVVLPALPWIFLALILGFVGSSILGMRQRPAAVEDPLVAQRRLAGLTELAIAQSGLIRDPESAASTQLTRALSALSAAREAIEKDVPAGELLDTAQSELDDAATTAGLADYQPATYLQGRE